MGDLEEEAGEAQRHGNGVELQQVEYTEPGRERDPQHQHGAYPVGGDQDAPTREPVDPARGE